MCYENTTIIWHITSGNTSNSVVKASSSCEDLVLSNLWLLEIAQAESSKWYCSMYLAEGTPGKYLLILLSGLDASQFVDTLFSSPVEYEGEFVTIYRSCDNVTEYTLCPFRCVDCLYSIAEPMHHQLGARGKGHSISCNMLMLMHVLLPFRNICYHSGSCGCVTDHRQFGFSYSILFPL